MLKAVCEWFNMRKAIVQCVCMRGTVSRKLVCGRLSQKSRVEITMNLREEERKGGKEREKKEGRERKREAEKKGEEGKRREGREGEEREGGKKEGSINITMVMSTSLLSAMSILNCLLSSDTASFQLFSPPHTYTPPTEFYNTHTYTPFTELYGVSKVYKKLSVHSYIHAYMAILYSWIVSLE